MKNEKKILLPIIKRSSTMSYSIHNLIVEFANERKGWVGTNLFLMIVEEFGSNNSDLLGN
jgi:hypothetical protein